MIKSIKLTNQEKISLVKIVQETGDMRAKTSLIQSCIDLGRSIIKKKFYYRQDTEDLEQIAAMSISACVDKFNLNSGKNFSTPCYLYIRNGIINYCKKNPLNYFEDIDSHFDLAAPTPNPDIVKVQSCLQKMTPGERKTLNRHFSKPAHQMNPLCKQSLAKITQIFYKNEN